MLRLSISIICLLLFGWARSQDPFTDKLVLQIPEMEKVSFKTVEFKKVNDTALTFDIYFPKGYNKKDKLPLVLFNNGVGGLQIPRWGQYTNWSRLIAASGMIAITHQARPGNALADGESVVDYIVAHANELGIDASKIALWTCSANTRAGMRIAHKTRPANIKTLVVYYGTPDSLGQLRQNLPTLLVRAGQDVQFTNMGMEQMIQNALMQDTRLEVINYLNGIHAFDVFTNTDESREVIRKTVTYLKENLNAPAIQDKFVITHRNFMWLMNNNMAAKALSEFRKARDVMRADSNYNPFFNGLLREEVMNTNAYWLLQHNKEPEALETFKLIVETFPASPNAYDGLADAHEALGNKADAITASRKALELLPTATGLNEQFKTAIRRSAEEKINRIKL